MSPTARSVSTRTPARRGRKAPAPTVVLLVRHGVTPTTGKMLPGQAAGLHLADKGVVQATAAADRIAGLAKPPTAVYASPLERTRETAAPIARALGLRVRTAPGLVEVDVGDWTEKPLTRLYRDPQWPTVQRWPSGFRFPGGESFAEMSLRSMDTVLGLVADHPGETIVAVSHADPIKAILAAAAGLPLDLLQRLVISPCSISALLFTAGGPVVLCMNSTGTLNELALS
ncbi:MAG TPA: histidine phosphatase family protein [Acidimicrobiales bacterium]|nr:histidine phosphatase family protein [Acidimicrobiales bacterium]